MNLSRMFFVRPYEIFSSEFIDSNFFVCSVSLDAFQQTLMGIFYYVHSVALIEDLPLKTKYDDPKVFYQEANKAYEQVRNNSFF